MKILSRADLEAIGAKVIRAYSALPGVAGQVLERVDIDHLCQGLLGLQIDYRHLSKNGVKLGLTSFCQIGVEVFPEEGEAERLEDQFYMLDGKTLLIESELARDGANIGRRNYTVSHETCHHILKLLFPRDYGAQTTGSIEFSVELANCFGVSLNYLLLGAEVENKKQILQRVISFLSELEAEL